jgi:hypothetical protein
VTASRASRPRGGSGSACSRRSGAIASAASAAAGERRRSITSSSGNVAEPTRWRTCARSARTVTRRDTGPSQRLRASGLDADCPGLEASCRWCPLPEPLVERGWGEEEGDHQEDDDRRRVDEQDDRQRAERLPHIGVMPRALTVCPVPGSRMPGRERGESRRRSCLAPSRRGQHFGQHFASEQGGRGATADPRFRSTMRDRTAEACPVALQVLDRTQEVAGSSPASSIT